MITRMTLKTPVLFAIFQRISRDEDVLRARTGWRRREQKTNERVSSELGTFKLGGSDFREGIWMPNVAIDIAYSL